MAVAVDELADALAVCDLGDRLSEALREGQESLLAMTITTQGRRELILYTSDAEAALGRLGVLLTDGQTHEVGADVERDTFWGMYRSFCRAAEQNEAEE